MGRSITRTAQREDVSSFLLHEEHELAASTQFAVVRARELGATASIATARETAGLSVRVRDQAVETAARDGAQSMTVTVFDGGRTGRASTEALTEDAIGKAVEFAVAIARAVEPDDGTGLADDDLLARKTPDIPLFAPSGLSVGDLARSASAVEFAVLDWSSRDRIRSAEAGASSHDMRWALATSQDFCRTGSASLHSLWSTVIAERDGAMARDSWQSKDRQIGSLDLGRNVGELAAARSTRKLGAQPLKTQRAAVLFDAKVATTLVHEFCQQLDGMSQVNRRTYLADPIGREAIAPHLDLTEDPFEPFGLASGAYDGEGVAGRRRSIVFGGTVSGLFLNSFAGRKLRMRSTGNADGVRNIQLSSRNTEPQDDIEAMFERLGTGLWLTELLGGNVDPVTGSYSKAAAGFWIEGGELVGPVNNFTVAGTLDEMLRGIVAVGSDVHRNGAIRSGSILIDSMQLAGR